MCVILYADIKWNQLQEMCMFFTYFENLYIEKAIKVWDAWFLVDIKGK